MKIRNMLFCLFFCLLISGLSACGSYYSVIYSRAVRHDGSSLTAYFVHGNPEEMNWDTSPFNDYSAYDLKNGMDYLPAVLDSAQGYNWGEYFTPDKGETRFTLRYIPTYYKFPWGYYFNENEVQKIEATDLDSLIYLAEFMPPQLKMVNAWYTLTDQQVSLLKSGICNYIYTVWPISANIYVSVRDSITTEELELYALEENIDGDLKIESLRHSFFFDTIGNDEWLASQQSFYNVDKKSPITLLGYLEDTQAKLRFTIVLLERNLLMPLEFKSSLNKEIKAAMSNISLMIEYISLPDRHSKEARLLFKELSFLVKTDRRPLLKGDKFWNTYARIILPHFSNCYENPYETWDELMAANTALEDIGIVVLEGLVEP